MKSGYNLKLQFASAGLALALVSGGCAMMEPRSERYIAPPMGSTWVTARRDTGSYGSGSGQTSSKMGEQVWRGQKFNAYASQEQTLLAHPDGRWVAQVRGDTPLVTWDPPTAWQWPLHVGKKMTRKFTVTVHATKQTIPVEVTDTIEAYEDVTVPAGTFKAFRVRSVDNAGNDNVTWISPELGIFVKQSLRRTATHSQGPGTRDTEVVSQTIRR